MIICPVCGKPCKAIGKSEYKDLREDKIITIMLTSYIHSEILISKHGPIEIVKSNECTIRREA